ncbi:MAG: MerR family DNA-binding transcriptional regulator [Luteibacter sp.]
MSELSERTGCHMEAVRYYEEVGLLPPQRTSVSCCGVTGKLRATAGADT